MVDSYLSIKSVGLKLGFLNQLWNVQHLFILDPEWDEHRKVSRPLAISINDSVVLDTERIFSKSRNLNIFPMDHIQGYLGDEGNYGVLVLCRGERPTTNLHPSFT